MSLPVLPSSAIVEPERLLRLYAQADGELSLPLGDDEALEMGRAIANPSLSRIPDANAIFSAVQLGTPAQTIECVDAWFSGKKARCLKWSLREPAPPLEEELVRRGFVARAAPVWRLTAAPELAIDPSAQVIPARASYRLARELAQSLSDAIDPQIAEAFMRRLDDPRVECLMLLQSSRAVARVMVLSMGDVGIVTSLNVLPDQRGRGIGREMLGRALELCARAGFLHVMTEIEPCDARGQSLYTSMGFVPIGSYTTYTRTSPAGAPPACVLPA